MELERNLDCVWKAHARIGEIVSHCAAQDSDKSPLVDVGKLIIELESKSLRIRTMQEERDRSLRELAAERDIYAYNLRQHQARIMELQSLVQAGSAQNATGSSECTLGKRRKRNRGRNRTTQLGPPRDSENVVVSDQVDGV